jgi:hypothetical protein
MFMKDGTDLNWIKREARRIRTGLLTGDRSLADLAKKFVDPNFRLARRLVWGHRKIRWHELGTPPKERRPARFSRVKPTPADAHSFKGRMDIEAWLKSFVAMTNMKDGAPDPLHWWRGRYSDVNMDEFVDNLVSPLGTDIPTLAAKLLSLLRRGNPVERAFVHAVAGLDFTRAAELVRDLEDKTRKQASALEAEDKDGGLGSSRSVATALAPLASEYPLLLMRLVMLMTSFRVQTAARALQDWDYRMSEGVFAKLGRLVLGLPRAIPRKESGKISWIQSGSFARRLGHLSRLVTRMLRFSKAASRTGLGVAGSGRSPGFVAKRVQRQRRRESVLERRTRRLRHELKTNMHLDEAQRRRKIAELAEVKRTRRSIVRQAKKANAVLKPLYGNILEGLPAMMGRLRLVYDLRHEALRITLAETRPTSPARPVAVGADVTIDFAGTRSFSAVSCGLTPRALLMALTVEFRIFARHFIQCPPEWPALAAQMDYRVFNGLRIGSSKLIDAAPFFKPGNRAEWRAALESIKPLAMDLDLGDFDNRDLDKDIRIGMRFLEFIYHDVDWTAGFPNPFLDAASYRQRQWMSLYVRFGILGHLLPAPPARMTRNVRPPGSSSRGPRAGHLLRGS